MLSSQPSRWPATLAGWRTPLLIRHQLTQEVDDTRRRDRLLERGEGFELAEPFRVRARDDDA
jgi:hypothetical protein